MTEFKDATDFWAPSVIKLDDTYYIYVSCISNGDFQFMHVAEAKSPLGPFKNEKKLYNRFSIDSHMVKTEVGLFLWFAQNNTACEKQGTRIFIDKFKDPYTPENNPTEVVVPTFPEEKFTPNCTKERDWYTIEGPFWFKEGKWQYLMYSGGCFQDDTYHIGYCVAESNESDLKKVNFKKVTKNGAFNPIIIKMTLKRAQGITV